MSRASGLLGAFSVSVRSQLEETRTNPAFLVLGVIQPAVFLLVTLSPRDQGAAEVSRLVSGVLLTSFWGATVWSAAGILRRERFQGTLSRMLTGVPDPRVVVLGKSFGASAGVTASILLTAGCVLLLLRQPVLVGRWSWVLLGLAVTLASGAALGVMIGSLFVLTRYGPHLSSALMYPVFLLGGMIVPLDLIPPGVRWLSAGISMRWLQEFFVSAAGGSPNLAALAAAAGLTGAYGVIGLLLFGGMVDRVRRKGTLDLF